MELTVWLGSLRDETQLPTYLTEQSSVGDGRKGQGRGLAGNMITPPPPTAMDEDGYGGWWLLVIHVLIYEYKSHIQKDAGDAEMAEKAQGSKDTLSTLIFETNEMSDWHFHMVQGGTHTQY